MTLFKLDSTGAVAREGARVPTVFTSTEPWQVTRIQTYHYNGAKGAPLGTISLKATDGTVYGPWSTTSADGQGGVKNAFWVATPNLTLPPGTYTVVDSDPATWSQNADTKGAGMVWIFGRKLTAGAVVESAPIAVTGAEGAGHTSQTACDQT